MRAEGGGPIRTVIQAVLKRPTGEFPSLKAGRPLPWESIAERHFIWVCEADWDVRAFMMQPMRMEFRMSDGRTLVYFPDCERLLASTAIEIIEIKRSDDEHRRDPEYSFKLWLAKRVCKLRGWNFRILSAETYLAEGHRLANARLIRMDRFAAISSQDYLRLGEAFRLADGTMPWGAVVTTLSRTDDEWSPQGLARLRALIVRRHVRVDITRRITQQTPVVLTESAAIKLGK
ncbi:TnsA endonuclease N-terminal domain-containing protein [Bradyrhizobium guangzhouense]|uniref:TnsA endonuclease N-terminal domain-containing protein n=1 Tax=Bradyrhizobium guangzhouense TaxID=1325095 RepID=UPI0010093AD4|nr:TnsA endonuclease N-terminal domain-containing protein [Bradyrhizobium guangzhouense]